MESVSEILSRNRVRLRSVDLPLKQTVPYMQSNTQSAACTCSLSRGMDLISVSTLFVLNFAHLGFQCYFLLRIFDYEADDLGSVDVCRSINKFAYWDWLLVAAVITTCAASFSWGFLILNLPLAYIAFQRASNGTFYEKDPWWRRGGHLEWGRLPQTVSYVKQEAIIQLAFAFTMFVVYFVASVVE